jgi:hypothetical protein
VRLLAQGDGLRDHVQTSHDDGATQRDEGAESLKRLSDLSGKFSRGRQDESEQRLGLLEEGLQDREGKGGSLSATCLGEANDVAALEGDGDGFGLDGRGTLVVEGLAGFA